MNLPPSPLPQFHRRGADFLSSIRALPLAASIGVHDPVAALFGPDNAALDVDVSFAKLLLARYKYFSTFFDQCCERFEQILLLGTGFDMRSISSTHANQFRPLIIEIDRPEMFRQKEEILAQLKVAIPPHVRYLAADLSAEDLLLRLVEAGFDPSLPTAILAEGVIYFLPEPVSSRLFSPDFLGLPRSSVLLVDVWSNALVDRRNRGKAPPGFQRSPLPERTGEWSAHLHSAGFAAVDVQSMSDVMMSIWKERLDPFPGWMIVEQRW